MKVDPKLLDESPLTVRQKEILQRIDVRGETLTKVAKDFGRSKATLSKRRKTALKRYAEWVAHQKRVESDELAKLRATYLQLERRLNVWIEALEKQVGVTGEYAGYLGGLKLVADEIGTSRARTCAHAVNDRCKKWSGLIVDPKTCGICGDYEERPREILPEFL